MRTFIIDDKSGQKPTLVMTHGALTSSIIFYRMLESLSNKYRIVLFDNLGWGLNTRPQECRAKESPEASEEWMRKWILNCINALDVPEKFFLFGNSMGAWLLCQYASQCPKRVSGLFVTNPIGLSDYDIETWPGYA